MLLRYLLTLYLTCSLEYTGLEIPRGSHSGKQKYETKIQVLFMGPQKVWGEQGGAADNVLVQDPKENITGKLLSGVFMNALGPV